LGFQDTLIVVKTLIKDCQMQTKTTLEIKALTFADWQAIASACSNSNTWAFYKWVENCSDLEKVSRAEMSEIAKELGYSIGWVANKIDEYC
jgi:Ni,Fe-hydrogenase III large subunit